MFNLNTSFIFELLLVVLIAHWKLNVVADNDKKDTNSTNATKGNNIKSNQDGILNSLKNLTKWAIKEENIYKLAKVRYTKLKRELKILEDYIEDYEDTTGKVLSQYVKDEINSAEDRGKLLASNGITSYRMKFRYANHLIDLRKAVSEYDHQLEDELKIPLNNDTKNNSNGNETEYYGTQNWPGFVDLKLSMQAFIHIHQINGFKLDELSSALSLGSDKPAELNAFHCVQIGLYALTMEYYSLSVEWLEYSVRRIMFSNDESISLMVVQNYLDLAVRAHNKVFLEDKAEYIATLFTEKVTPMNDTLRIKRQDMHYDIFKGNKEDNYTEINFLGICKGENLQFQEERSNLYCWYERDSNPAWYINPLKMEVLSEDPQVVQIYDIVGEKMIQSIINISEKNLSRSLLISDHEISDLIKSRSSVNSWLKYDELPHLTRKIELITGLNLQGSFASEQLQVVEYIFGGIFSPHTDPLEDFDIGSNFSNFDIDKDHVDYKKVQRGDRVATVLFYLNDVEAGGQTPFTNAGTFAEPVKGSAILWYSMFRNGTVRRNTNHGSCPVLAGHKIVANKWIRYNSQFQTYKCSLNPND